MVPHIERIAENCMLAEGPHWDKETQSLYFVDIAGQAIYRYVPATKKVTKASTGAHVSLIIPVKGQKDTFVISSERELRIVSWNGESDNFTVLKKIENDSGNNINDGKCDPKGRLWTGTMALKEDGGGVVEGVSEFYVVEKDKITKVADKITVSNGLAFNTGLKKMYYIDSPIGTVDEFDFDLESGTVENRKPIFTLSRHDIPGYADGMTIDSDGNLWVSIFGGGRIVKIDPRKPESLLYTLSLPAKQPTSVAFGGSNLDELYITTARIKFGPDAELLPPENGAIYKVTGLGVRGFPGERFVL
ncbi:hypothetical protein NQ315_008171 [Exocentrus adspersus]|uniref:Regucalcin n=1 Tax=Exocentrus adspersus TaxID=1586481 RepID=A0AAV8VW63_9CUCU|nr:hypothetical protein NQ315_008171 [Exocentrus adspersus]